MISPGFDVEAVLRKKQARDEANYFAHLSNSLIETESGLLVMDGIKRVKATLSADPYCYNDETELELDTPVAFYPKIETSLFLNDPEGTNWPLSSEELMLSKATVCEFIGLVVLKTPRQLSGTILATLSGTDRQGRAQNVLMQYAKPTEARAQTFRKPAWRFVRQGIPEKTGRSASKHMSTGRGTQDRLGSSAHD